MHMKITERDYAVWRCECGEFLSDMLLEDALILHGPGMAERLRRAGTENQVRRAV